jgi:hypothetical protein
MRMRNRKTLFIGSFAALVALILGTAVPGALAQGSGVDQYIEDPGPVPEQDGGGGGGGGSGGSGGGTEPSPSAPAPSPSAPAPASGGGAVDSQGTASGTTTTDASGAARSGDSKSRKQSKDDQKSAGDKGNDAGKGKDSVLAGVESSVPDNSGSGGLGIVLPIILGALLLGAGVVALVHRRRRTQSANV